MAIVAYIIFLFRFFVDGAKDSPFVKFHVNQGLLIAIAYFVVSILGMIPLLGLLLAPIGGLVVFIIHLITLIGAANGQAKKLPLLGDIKLIK